MFSPLVLSQWVPDDVREVPAGEVVVSVDPSLPASRSVSLLRREDGSAVLSVTPERARELDLIGAERVDEAALSARIERTGIAFNDPDHLFYLTLGDQAALRGESFGVETRQLTAADAASFEDFTREAPEDDIDEAFVELDHWLVFGTFIGGTLVSAASMYPWSGTHLADLGVITLPAFRGRGLGRVTVRAMSAEALRRGYEPQYRCQLDNAASVALAQAAGFTRFGEWEVIDADE
ncbi:MULTISPECIES: GNAT family N-acetyltransferase [unclassified Microbacterium]|uniref:GNAT family N-acetyltransferase n=1 Tax=unclassified Microbacterium TaxID=2609290 RepID=UPI003018ABF4